jgi:IS1 family transposase
MNRLPLETRARIIGMLVEGVSLRSASRLCSVSINTVTKLLLDVAEGAAAYHDQAVQNISAKCIQCDEIWCFAGAKAKNVTAEQKQAGWGDTWTWTAIDKRTKLCISYLVGGRDAGWAREFMRDCANRIRGSVQITSDGHRVYLNAVEETTGADIEYAMLQKIYRVSMEPECQYSPACCVGCDMKVVSSNPDPKHVSTSFGERQNLKMRMGMRSFTWPTNAFSKKIENHAAAVALHLIHYNFARIHKTLRVTPAMEAELSDHVWSLEEIVLLAN